MAILDEVRRRAAQAKFEAERLVRSNRTQTRISALQGQLHAGASQLGAITLDLIARGELAHPELVGISDQLLALRTQIEALEAEVRAIRAEVFTEEPTSITCPSCGAVSAADGRFCRKCGTPLQPGGQVVQGMPAAQYAPAPVEEPAPAGQEIVCARCAATNPPGMRFCVHCGTRLPIGTAGPTAPAWSGDTPAGATWPGSTSTGTPSSRSASREAPTVRMPTLDPALAPNGQRNASQAGPAPAEAVEADVRSPEGMETPRHADPEQPAPANVEAPVSADAEPQGSSTPASGALPAPSTWPLGAGANDTPPNEASAEPAEKAPEKTTEASPTVQSVPICPSCGEPVVEGAAFCVTCGTRVAPA